MMSSAVVKELKRILAHSLCRDLVYSTTEEISKFISGSGTAVQKMPYFLLCDALFHKVQM